MLGFDEVLCSVVWVGDMFFFVSYEGNNLCWWSVSESVLFC